MSQVLPYSSTPPDTPRKLWTRAECRQLLDFGILEEGRFELIHGDIIPKMTQHEPHIHVCRKTRIALEAIFGSEYVRLAAPVVIGDYEEPEPDVAVMTRRDDDYLSLGTPLPEDVRLAVEVSVSTLRGDMTDKALSYASVAIPEYWVIDVNARRLEVFRQPTAGGYSERSTIPETGFISPLAASDKVIAVAELLPRSPQFVSPPAAPKAAEEEQDHG